ncbi:MAG: hypothetical protein IIW06_08695 [Bacteroidaceae bacterium]|nr:hypothetical protein [Bacteroidaceae bacterium]
MKKTFRNLLCSVAALALPLVAFADNKAKEDNTYSPLYFAVEYSQGGASWIDKSLSYYTFTGSNFSIGAEIMRAANGDSKWVQQHQLRYINSTGHIAISGMGGSQIHFGNYTFGMMSHSTVAPQLRLYYGFDINLLAGVVNNDHGGNNPFTIKGDLSVGFTGMAVYDFKLGKLPITARYQMSLPVLSVFTQTERGYMFSDFTNFVKAGSWNNHFNMRNRVHFDLRFKTWALRLGYNNDIVTHYATDNHFQYVSHNFVIGFAGDLIRWGKNNDNKIIKPALYTY